MSKYHSTKTTIDGIKFDSKAEAERYAELKLLERGNVITDLTLQPEFELIPAFRKNGKTYRKTTYRADFMYFDVEKGKYVIEDVKGYLTDVFKLKRKMFEFKYPQYEIKEEHR